MRGTAARDGERSHAPPCAPHRASSRSRGPGGSPSRCGYRAIVTFHGLEGEPCGWHRVGHGLPECGSTEITSNCTNCPLNGSGAGATSGTTSSSLIRNTVPVWNRLAAVDLERQSRAAFHRDHHFVVDHEVKVGNVGLRLKK